jgi:hypothetical protein
MQDRPDVHELITAVQDFLRDRATPELDGRTQFLARVAFNALGIVQRQLEIAPESDAAEHERLRRLLQRDGTLEELNRELCERIRADQMGVEDEALVDHLWKNTMAKLAVDQPKYSAYRRELERR